MIFSNVIVYSVLLLFCVKVTFTRELSKRASKYNVDNMPHTFAKLLKTIVRVNEERLNGVKKISELQDYMLTKNRLRTDEYTYDSLEDDDAGVFLALGDPPKRRTVNEKATIETCNKLFNNNNNIRLWRRQFMKQACHDQTVDFCVDVCTRSVANVCDSFNCDKVDKDIRNECYKNCRSVLVYEEP